jgi:DNA-binding transcriptional LysR family regulator
MDHARLPWDDLKLLIAAYRAGSLNALADQLAMDPTTASRRMKALEKSVGLSLFVRTHGALRLTAEARQSLDMRVRWKTRSARSGYRSKP